MSDPRRMDDTDFMRHVLADGDWHGQMEIIGRSIEIRGHGLTPHSRASTLRERGFRVENRQHVVNGRRVSEYRLTLNESVGDSSPESSADSLSATVRKRESSEDGRLLADGTPSYGPSGGPTGSAESESLAPGSLSTPGADPASQLLIWEAA
jgi:hypothetical protein